MASKLMCNATTPHPYFHIVDKHNFTLLTFVVAVNKHLCTHISDYRYSKMKLFVLVMLTTFHMLLFIVHSSFYTCEHENKSHVTLTT